MCCRRILLHVLHNFYISLYVYTIFFLNLHVYVYVYIYTYMCMYVYIYMYVYVYVCISVYLLTEFYVYMSMYIDICIYICIYIYVYAYISIFMCSVHGCVVCNRYTVTMFVTFIDFHRIHSSFDRMKHYFVRKHVSFGSIQGALERVQAPFNKAQVYFDRK